jgi:hypothetical protein
MNRKQQIASHLDLMAEIIIAELEANGGYMTRIDLCEALGLSLVSYPQEAHTQASTTWLCSILIRRLQDAGRVRYEHISPNRVAYRLTGK